MQSNIWKTFVGFGTVCSRGLWHVDKRCSALDPTKKYIGCAWFSDSNIASKFKNSSSDNLSPEVMSTLEKN